MENKQSSQKTRNECAREERRRRAERYQQRKERRKVRRRVPYSEDTRLVDLVRPSAYERMEYLFRGLRPYLVNPQAARRTPYIEFDLARLKGHRTEVYRAIAKFLYFGRERKVLKVPVAVFARFLTDKNHSNFSVGFKPLIVKVKETQKRMVLT